MGGFDALKDLIGMRASSRVKQNGKPYQKCDQQNARDQNSFMAFTPRKRRLFAKTHLD